MRIESAKHQAERECTEVKRREDSAKPNPKGAQVSARSPLCNPSEFSSKHPLKATCRNVLRPSFSRARCISELKKWVNSRKTPYIHNDITAKFDFAAQTRIDAYGRVSKRSRALPPHQVEDAPAHTPRSKSLLPLGLSATYP